MASKSRPRPKRQPNQLADLGLFNIPDLELADNVDDDSDVDESVLESELEALLSGKAPARPTRPKPKVAPVVDIEKLAEACLKDDDDDDDDGNLSGDEDLLSELQNITADSTENNEPPQNDEPPEQNEPPSNRRFSNSHSESSQSESSVSLLQERLAMYNEAVNAAKLMRDSSKVRRYGRAIKTLEGLIKSAKSGATINEEDIPPVVKIPKVNIYSDSSHTANSDKPVTSLSDSGSDGTPAAGLSNSIVLNGTQHIAKAASNIPEEPHLSSSEDNVEMECIAPEEREHDYESQSIPNSIVLEVDSPNPTNSNSNSTKLKMMTPKSSLTSRFLTSYEKKVKRREPATVKAANAMHQQAEARRAQIEEEMKLMKEKMKREMELNEEKFTIDKLLNKQKHEQHMQHAEELFKMKKIKHEMKVQCFEMEKEEHNLKMKLLSAQLKKFDF